MKKRENKARNFDTNSVLADSINLGNLAALVLYTPLKQAATRAAHESPDRRVLYAYTNGPTPTPVPVLVIVITVAASPRSVLLELVGNNVLHTRSERVAEEAAVHGFSVALRTTPSAGPHERVWVPEHEIESGR